MGDNLCLLGITYVCFIHSRLPVFAVEPQYQHRDFLIFVESIIWKTHTHSSKTSCWFTIWMGSVRPILIKLRTFSIWGFLYLSVWCPLGSYLCKHDGDHSVTSEVCSSPHLTCLGLCAMEVWKLNGANRTMPMSKIRRSRRPSYL